MTEIQKQIEYLLMHTRRDNIGALIRFLENTGFYESPCSTQYHLCKPGGLAEHSLGVYRCMIALNDALAAELPEDSTVIVSLLHDVGKAGETDKPLYAPNILKGDVVSSSKPYITNKDLAFMPHEVRGLKNICKFIDLTEDEEHAILHHNGMYGDLKYLLTGKERPLQMMLHFADMWASRVEEVGIT